MLLSENTEFSIILSIFYCLSYSLYLINSLLCHLFIILCLNFNVYKIGIAPVGFGLVRNLFHSESPVFRSSAGCQPPIISFFFFFCFVSFWTHCWPSHQHQHLSNSKVLLTVSELYSLLSASLFQFIFQYLLFYSCLTNASKITKPSYFHTDNVYYMLDIVQCLLPFKKFFIIWCLVSSFIFLLWLPTLCSLLPGWCPYHCIRTIAGSPML